MPQEIRLRVCARLTWKSRPALFNSCWMRRASLGTSSSIRISSVVSIFATLSGGPSRWSGVRSTTASTCPTSALFDKLLEIDGLDDVAVHAQIIALDHITFLA